MFPAGFAIFIHFPGGLLCIKDYVFIDPAFEAGIFLPKNSKEGPLLHIPGGPFTELLAALS